TTLFRVCRVVQTRLPNGADESPERSIAIGWVVTTSPRTFRFTEPMSRCSASHVAACCCATKLLGAAAPWLARPARTGKMTSPTQGSRTSRPPFQPGGAAKVWIRRGRRKRRAAVFPLSGLGAEVHRRGISTAHDDRDALAGPRPIASGEDGGEPRGAARLGG